ncbi:MAG: hypothetical protein DRI87_00130 [Bacteroidetes bacterium]|nr:MAG: hypothetical protein DRI87_00130 [Bacteroidota bacterium]
MTNNDNSGPVLRNLSSQTSEDYEIKKILKRLLSYWYWFLICIILAVSIAYVYNRYATPIYEITSSLLLEVGNSNSPLTNKNANEDNVFQGFGITDSDRNIFNQLIVLTSTPILNRTLEELDFDINYYSVGRVKSREIYKESPFEVIWDYEHPQLIYADFLLEILPDGKLLIKVEDEHAAIFDFLNSEIVTYVTNLSFSKEAAYNEVIKTDYFSFIIKPKRERNKIETATYKFRFNIRSDLLKQYKNDLSVNMLSQETSIIELSLKTLNVAKGIDFLNTLVAVYQAYTLERKNENASRTINFISTQLQTVSDSLGISENAMQAFQSKHKLLNISIQSEQLLDQVNELEKEKVVLETKNKYYKYLREYIINNQELETIIAPSAMDIDDPLLNALILELNNLSIEKSSMTSVKNTEHPKLKRLNAQIENAKSNLLENVNNIISQSELALTDVKNRLWRYERRIQTLPETERNYINIERKYQLNNETYTFLLQKLTDAQIARASNVSDSRVIEDAHIKGIGPVEPKKSRIYLIALFLGLFVPALIILMKYFSTNKITTVDDIKEITNAPVVGLVFNTRKDYKGNTLILDKPGSPASEQYRSVKNKINFISGKKSNPVIAFTSSIANEGKSFSALNIASLYALSKKKTVLLDLDLRMSSMAKNLELDTDKGVVSYLTGEAGIDDITFSSKHPDLDIIPAGPIPSNPAELLIDERLEKLMDKLKSTYDMIIVDTSPVGVVADALQITSQFDIIIFVVRQRMTKKQVFKSAIEELQNFNVDKLGVLFNDVSSRDMKHGYGYTLGYGYGLGYGRTAKK